MNGAIYEGRGGLDDALIYGPCAVSEEYAYYETLGINSRGEFSQANQSLNINIEV
jgi:hypothetical protein